MAVWRPGWQAGWYGANLRFAYAIGTPDVIYVDNLNDSGTGSLRDGIEWTGPRIVVPRVSGNVVLDSSLKINYPGLIFAGQCGPSPGLSISGAADASVPAGSIEIYSHDILLQHLRVRPGDGGPVTRSTATGRDGILLYLTGAYNVALDHMSIAFAPAKNIACYSGAYGESMPPSNVLIYRCILTYPMFRPVNVTDFWETAPSGLNCLLAGFNENNTVAIVECLLSHAPDRNPELGEGGTCQFINNYVFDTGCYDPAGGGYRWCGPWIFAQTPSLPWPSKLDVIGNVFESSDRVPALSPAYMAGVWSTKAGSGMYLADNLRINSGFAIQAYDEDRVSSIGLDVRTGSPTIGGTSSLTIRSSALVKAHVIANAGCRPFDRDPLDEAVVDDCETGRGQIVSSQDEVSAAGWDSLDENTNSPTPPSPSDEASMQAWLESQTDPWELGTDPPPPDDSEIVVIGENTGNDETGVEETYLKSDATTTNLGSSAVMDVYKSSSGEHHHGLIRFDLSSLPANATITDAKLSFYLVGASGDANTHVISARRCLRAWTEGGATYTKFDGTTNWATAGGLDNTLDRASVVSGTMSVPNASAYYHLTGAQLIADLQGMVDGSYVNNGWHLERTDGLNDTTYRTFTTSEGTDGHRPYLTVTYVIAQDIFILGNNSDADLVGTDDTHIRAEEPTVAHGSDVTLNVYKYTGAGVADDYALIRFTGLASLLSSRVVTDVAIGLWLETSNSAGTSQTITAKRLLRNWTPAGATYNKYDGTNNWGTAGGLNTTTDTASAASGTMSVSTASGAYYELTGAQLIADVQGIIDGTYPNHGWHFQRTDGSNDTTYRAFGASEAADGKRPYLRVSLEAMAGGDVASGAAIYAYAQQ